MNSTCEPQAQPGLKPYPSYKNSGVEWLGQVPAHWRVAAVKRHYAIRLGKMLQPARRTSDDSQVAYLKAKHIQWFKVQTTDIDTMWATPEEVNRYRVVGGDLLVCEGGEGGRCGTVRQETAVPDPCIIQNALHRVRPRALGSVGDTSRNDYLQYMMSTIAAAGWFDVLTDKATIAHFTAEKFGALLTPIPPATEQAAIVRFLDHADRRIQRHIRAKQKLIALLEEQKQGIIHDAVTGRIDVRTGRPYSAYKYSGSEWLVTVPVHWRVLPLKRAFVSMDYGISDTGTDEGTIPVLTMADIDRNGTVTVPENGGVTSVATRLLLQDKDLLFNRTNGSAELVGKVGLFRTDGRAVTFASYLVRMRARPENKPEFLNSLLNDVDFMATARREAIATLQFNLNPSRYGRLQIPLPPTEEQEAVVGFVDANASRVDSAIARTKHQIALLSRFRTRITADVVTGKLDVRGDS